MSMDDCFVFTQVKGGYTVHAFGCQWARKGTGPVILPDEVAGHIADTRERGFMVITCPCARAKLKGVVHAAEG